MTAEAYGAGPDRPSSARIHNLWLGGSWHTPADEAKAAEIEQICPAIRQMAADSRLFTTRVTGWAAADLGIGQFIDLGAGVPPGPAVHDMARSVRPGSRVVYADADAEVVDYLRDVALDGRQCERTGVIAADLSAPGTVLAHPELLRVITPSRPVCLILALVLQAWSPARARAIVRGYARLLAPGSVVAVSTPRVDDEIAWGRLAKAYAPAPSWNFTAAEVSGLLGGLELVPPGVGAAFALRPGSFGVPCKRGGHAYVLGGIGIVP